MKQKVTLLIENLYFCKSISKTIQKEFTPLSFEYINMTVGNVEVGHQRCLYACQD